jgi:hypothetical protein
LERIELLGIRPCALPPEALLASYAQRGAYTDCYCTDTAQPCSHAAYVEAFYTTWVFRTERVLLRWFAARPSTDAQARQLAVGASQAFAAWRVEARGPDQLLMCDMTGRTRSWLMVAAGPAPEGMRLYFGSAVVPVIRARTGRPGMGWLFRALLGFHTVYSRVLLAAARRRLVRG